MDVRKQEHGISAFYRNFINQRVGETVEQRPQQKFLDKITENLRKQMMDDKDKEIEDKTEFKKSSKSAQSKRQRKLSSSSEDEDFVVHKIRKDKDRRESKKKESKKDEKDLEGNNDKQKEEEVLEKKETNTNKDANTDLNKDTNKETDKEDVAKEEKKDLEPERPKLTLREILTELFRKKCVDEVFVEAQKRYFERKANY